MSDTLEITGKLIVKEDTKAYGQSGFLKRLIVVETSDKYPQKIPIEFVQNKSDLPDPYRLNEDIIVSYNLRGNEHNGNYYLSLQGWKIQRVPLSGAQPTPQQPTAQQPVNPMPPQADSLPEEDEDDLPF